MIDFTSYPVSALFGELKKEYRPNQTIVIKADPGAGKSAILPLFLLEENLAEGKIIMLEPRRMAARTLAHFMSRLTGTECGSLIGYRIKGDSRCRPGARIEIVTEGVFVRMIQDDPFLEGVSLVIMDEFHERNLMTDLSFAFIRDVQRELNPGLKLMIMTATPELDSIRKIIPDHLYLECRGRMFPVTVESDGQALETRVRPSRVRYALQDAMTRCEGNILIFLPGEGEIRDFLEEVKKSPLAGEIEVLPLYSRLSRVEQDRVLNPGSGRIAVAATSVAETSLTIPGIGCVIDTGLERKPVFDVNAGLSRLMTRAVSRSSARQRTGRAGRVREGLCIRLWNDQDEYRMEDHPESEILHTDLCSLVLEILLWGVRDYRSLDWIDPPPAAHFHQAETLLRMLGLIDPEGGLLAQGRELAGMGIHPRLAHMLFLGRTRELEQTACALASILTEGDWIDSGRGSDLRLRLEALKETGGRGNRKTAQIMASWKNLLSKGTPDVSLIKPEYTGELLCLSFPDRVGIHRGDRVYQLAGGGECSLNPSDPLQGHDYIIAPLVGGGGSIPRCFLSAPLEKEEILRIFSNVLTEEKHANWDEKKNRLLCRKVVKLGVLILGETGQEPDLSHPSIREELKSSFEKRGLAVLPWSRDDLRFLDRCRFVSHLNMNQPGWPDFTEPRLIELLDSWFTPLLVKGRLEGRLKDGLLSLLTWEEQSYLKKEVPESLTVPSGSRISIDYTNPASPAVEVRLQELFGLTETPMIAGRVPLLFKMLNPARRPIQVTRDLNSFWKTTYPEVRKELRGRYPKHYWPEDPFDAQATSRVRPK